MFLTEPLFAKTNHCKIQKFYKKADYFTWDSAFGSKKKTGPWYCDLERLISHEIPGVGQTKTCLKLINKTVKCCEKIKGIVLASLMNAPNMPPFPGRRQIMSPILHSFSQTSLCTTNPKIWSSNITRGWQNLYHISLA